MLEPREPWLRLLAGAEAGRFGGSSSAPAKSGLQDGGDTQRTMGSDYHEIHKMMCIYIYITVVTIHSYNQHSYIIAYNYWCLVDYNG